VSLPFPQIDIVGAMMIVWRVRGKVISFSVVMLRASLSVLILLFGIIFGL